MYPVVQHNRQVAFALVMELQVTIFIITVTLHGCLHGSNSQPLSEAIQRNHTCDFESLSDCGWILDAPTESQGATAISTADSRPASGPSVDANPGTQNGNYFYFNSSALSQSERVLHFPHYSHICGLSFSYYVSGPLDLSLLFENLRYYTVYVTQSSNATGSSVWKRESFSFNSSDPFDGNLYFEVSPFDMGEAALEPGGSNVFLGLDDISLTFCLPCDFDRLDSDGGLVLDGPNEFTVRLRVTSQITYNATSLICPNEPMQYSIDSVEPPQVAGVFSIDPSKGVLIIRAQGEGLEPNGIQGGSIRISVYIPGSNYANIFSPVNRSLLVTFHQPPTITHTAPPTLPVQVNVSFSYQFTITSALGRNLNFGTLATDPSELVTDVSKTIMEDEARVSGVISLTRDLPPILENGTTPSISVPIVDALGGVVEATTQLIIEQSAPLFTHTHYVFSVMEENDVRTGPILIADPNGDQINIPVILEMIEAKLFNVLFGQSTGIFTNVFLLADITLDYELSQGYDFTLVVYDLINASLSSQASVRVNVIPVNEYAPVFIEADPFIEISDNEPEGSFVAEFTASDRDSGADGDITYSITSGNEDGFFQIAVPSFGDVSVKRTPIHPQTYILTITAKDGGNPSLSDDVTLTVAVTATQDVDCTDPEYGSPQITSSPPSRTVEINVSSELTLACQYTANPVVTVYKWVHVDDGTIILESTNHYTKNRYSLVVHNLTIEDAGVYECNLTNQCGDRTLPYLVHVIDYPDPPQNPQVAVEPDDSSFTITWDPPSSSAPPNPAVSRPLDGYEVRVRRDDDEDYQTVASVSSTQRTVVVSDLHPGTSYWVVVASVNSAGTSLSNPINITTLKAVPKLYYLRAIEQANRSLLIEWELQYNGGSEIISFEIHIILQAERTKRATPDLIYHVDVSAGQLTTRSLQSGHSYTVMGTLYNNQGSSNEFSYVYVGQMDSLLCDFEDPDCYWQPDSGQITTAMDAPSPLLRTDSTGNPQGHYISAISTAQEEVVLMSYPKAWYGCGYSFWYQLSSSGTLSLRTTSGHVIWSSSNATTGWERVTADGEQFFTDSQDEGLQFTLQGEGTAAGLDAVTLKFCLPCDFDLLLNNDEFNLTYPTNIKLFLRTEQTLTLSANLLGCSLALLDFTTSRVIPGDLESSFSLSQDVPHTLTISVSAIPADRVAPHTAGLIEVAASVVHSDYRPDNNVIERRAMIEFILLAATENCSFSETCDFEDSTSGCDSWQLGSGVQHMDGTSSPVKDLQTNQGTFLYGDYTSTTIPSSIVASSRIGDTYCAVSFSYSAPPTSELVVSVGGLGQIWTSILMTTGTTWTSELLTIDLESASLSGERMLEFSAGQSESFRNGLDTSLPVYVALDDITMHPCIDCNTPECTFTSCTPGRYFSLGEESCVPCPPGYYCPDWRDLPIPCPPGTYSQVTNAASSSVCMACLDNTYTLTHGSTSCKTCPPGHSCTNSSHYPIADDQCPMSTPAGTQEPEKVPTTTVIVGAAAGGVALLLCLLLSCVVGSWCYCSRRRGKPGKRDRRGRLLGEDVLTIGSAGSLGRSSLGSVSTFDSRGRKWAKGRDASTLMSFLSEDETDRRATSWEDTERLTTPPESDGGKKISVGFMNDGYDYQGDDEMQLVDLNGHEGLQSSRKPTNMSQF